MIVRASTQMLRRESSNSGSFDILKSDDLVIGGYASIEIVDKQNDLITLEALDDAVQKYMGEKKYRNVMSNHSNVQVGEVVENYRDKNGTLHKTEVDNVGFYVVIKLRDDIEKAKEISRGIRKGTLRSFSIGGQAISKRSKKSDKLGQYNEIDKLELHEVTICEKGINPEARFDILKQDVGGNKMSDKLEKALEELNGLMKQVSDIHKEEEEDNMTEAKGDMSYMDSEEEKMNYEEKAEDDEEMKADDEMDDDEAKALDMDNTHSEAGKEVVSGGNPTATPAPLKVSKGLESADFSTLNLSHENVEKAYEAFKAERLEKLAYDSLSKNFEARLETELSVKKSNAERAEYDAHAEVNALKTEFAELRKSLSATEIRKAQEVALPEGFPTSMDAIADMSWGDIHNLVGRRD